MNKYGVGVTSDKFLTPILDRIRLSVTSSGCLIPEMSIWYEHGGDRDPIWVRWPGGRIVRLSGIEQTFIAHPVHSLATTSAELPRLMS
jgi:hypothetical protein